MKITYDIKAKGFEQSHADPCLFRKIVDGEAVAVIVVYVDHLLISAKGSAEKDELLVDLAEDNKLKNMGEAK